MDDEEIEDVLYHVEPMTGGGYAHVLKFLDHEIIFMYRKKYTAYDEPPMEGKLGMNARTKKFLAKRTIEFIAAAVIGYIIKAEKKAETRIDEHFAPPKAETPED